MRDRTSLGGFARGVTRETAERAAFTLVWFSGGHGDAEGHLLRSGDGEIGLVHPAPRIGSPVPALQAERLHVAALFLVQKLKIGDAQTGSHLGRRAMQINQLLGTIVKDGHGTPALWLG